MRQVLALVFAYWGVTLGLVGYFGGQAAAHVLAQAGIVGAVVLAVLTVGAFLYVKLRGRARAHRS